MKLERTRDMGLVGSIMRDPAIWPHVHDDGVPADWRPIDHDGFHWMLVDDGEPAGVFLAHQTNSFCYEMHTCMLPRIWGDVAAKAAQMLAAHVFYELGGEKLITLVPAYNRAALRFAKSGGMQQEGINRASYRRNGVMIDQIMLGITKQEWITCQQQSQ